MVIHCYNILCYLHWCFLKETPLRLLLCNFSCWSEFQWGQLRFWWKWWSSQYLPTHWWKVLCPCVGCCWNQWWDSYRWVDTSVCKLMWTVKLLYGLYSLKRVATGENGPMLRPQKHGTYTHSIVSAIWATNPITILHFSLPYLLLTDGPRSYNHLTDTCREASTVFSGGGLSVLPACCISPQVWGGCW